MMEAREIMTRKHEVDRSRPVVVYHEFLTAYKRNMVFGFVEGKTDHSFYKHAIDNNHCFVSSAMRNHLWHCEGRDQVSVVYSHLASDWNRFDRNHIWFFTDRDLTDFDQTKECLSNWYVTDSYSIESEYVKPPVIMRVLKEVCGLHDLTYHQESQILGLYALQLEQFVNCAVPIMSALLFWKQNSIKAHPNNIHLARIIDYRDKPEIKADLSPSESLARHLAARCRADDRILNIDLCTYLPSQAGDIPLINLICGKYLLWFALQFCNKIEHLSITHLGMPLSTRKHVCLNTSDAHIYFSTRTQAPRSLHDFICNNLLADPASQ